MSPEMLRSVYNADAQAAICELTRNDGIATSGEAILNNPQAYEDVEIVFSTWGCPRLDDHFLDALPNLKALFYAAGSVRSFVTDAFWERDILLTSAYVANAVPVAEFTHASVIFALKRVWKQCNSLKMGKRYVPSGKPYGVYHGSRVGIISLGAIGRLVCEKLVQHDLEVCAYDPFAANSVFEELGVVRVSSLESLFATCDVVSLHAPWLKETEDLVTGAMLRSMPEDGTFINTSRGRIVDEAGMLEVLREREDLFAVLDLLQDESTFETNPLTSLPNVFITPHIAGSESLERHRMGAWAVEECRRYLVGEPPKVGLDKASAARLA
jgi:phosphoglycerate dehydrogenase-like enzyme